MTDDRPNPSTMSRRRALLMGLAGASVLFGGPALAALPRGGARTLALKHLHTGETLRVDYWAKGEYVPGALAELNHLLRDFRIGEQTEMDRGLFDLLHALRRRLDSAEPFHIISGYRSPQTNAMLRKSGGGVASHSLHMDGMAVDIRLPGRRISDLHRAARSLRAGGVGYYPKSNFVHVDTGRVRFW